MTQQKLTAQVNGRQALFVRFPREHLRGDPNSILVEAAIRSAIPNGGTSILSARRLSAIAGVDRERVAHFLRKRSGVKSDGQKGFVVTIEPPSRGWIKFPVAVLKARAAPTLRVVLVALWDRPHTAQQLAERFGKTPRYMRRVLRLLHRVGIARQEGRFWTLTPEAKLAWEQNPSQLARAVAALGPLSGGASSAQAAGESGLKCCSERDGIFDPSRPSLEDKRERESEDAAAAASSGSRSQLEERRRELEQQLEEARKPASERLRRHILAYCRVNGGPAGNVLAAAVHVYWEEVNTATARRFKALLEVRLPAMVREVAAAPDAPRQHKIARFLVGNAMAEAREDAGTEIESLRGRLERVMWRLEAQTEAARVQVSGAAGWYEEAEGRRVLTVTERVEVEARAAWVPPGREPVEVGRPAFFEARRELLLARLGAEASPPTRVPEEAVPEEPLEALARRLFRLRDLICDPPNLPTSGLS